MGWTLLALLSSLVCGYQNGRFTVVDKGSARELSVSPGYSDFVLSCGDPLAVLYDGDSLHVYDRSRGDFTSRRAAPRFRYARVLAERHVSAYDGRSFIVYDPHSSRWAQTGARNAYPHARLADSPELTGLYDGDHFQIFDARRQLFEKEPVSFHYPFFKLVAGNETIGAYDGTALVGYCDRDFVRKIVKKGASPTASLHQGEPAFRIENEEFRLDAKRCRWE